MQENSCIFPSVQDMSVVVLAAAHVPPHRYSDTHDDDPCAIDKFRSGIVALRGAAGEHGRFVFSQHGFNLLPAFAFHLRHHDVAGLGLMFQVDGDLVAGQKTFEVQQIAAHLPPVDAAGERVMQVFRRGGPVFQFFTEARRRRLNAERVAAAILRIVSRPSRWG